jgi:hypothetical protein
VSSEGDCILDGSAATERYSTGISMELARGLFTEPSEQLGKRTACSPISFGPQHPTRQLQPLNIKSRVGRRRVHQSTHQRLLPGQDSLAIGWMHMVSRVRGTLGRFGYRFSVFSFQFSVFSFLSDEGMKSEKPYLANEKFPEP